MHNEARIDAMLQQQDAAIKQHAESHLEHAAKTEEMYSPGRLLTPFHRDFIYYSECFPTILNPPD
jgi:hypothetical protein